MAARDWSVPDAEVMVEIAAAIDDPAPAVLATVAAVEGNAYRRPGAKMVVTAGGTGVGSVTAGCLEDEVVAIAEDVLETGRPRVETFDMTAEGDGVWGLGLGCNGVIDVLVEPLDERYRRVVEAREAGEDVVVLTVLDGGGTDASRGDRVLAPGGRVPADAAWPEWLLSAVREPAARLLEGDASDTVTVTDEGVAVEVFVDAVTAPPDLVVFGTGHDVGPVVDLGRYLDFRVTVVGFRGAVATGDRFPGADRVVSTSPADVREDVAFDADTCAVVMTHNFLDDRITVEELLETPVEYVGLMGPDDRFEEMVAEFETGRDGGLSPADLDRIYTPVGLDLGGTTPYQIAHSIVAEALAVHNGRDPGHLRERTSPIHDRVELDR